MTGEAPTKSSRDLGMLELLHWNTLLVTGALFIALVSISTFVKNSADTKAWVSVLLLVLAVIRKIT